MEKNNDQMGYTIWMIFVKGNKLNRLPKIDSRSIRQYDL